MQPVLLPLYSYMNILIRNYYLNATLKLIVRFMFQQDFDSSSIEVHPSHLSDQSTNYIMGSIVKSEDKTKMLSFIESNFGKLSEREMAKQLGGGKTAINRWRSDLGLEIEKPSVNEDYFKKWSSDMAYILGYIYADGNISWNPEKSYRSMTITACKKDVDHLEKVRSKLKSTKKLFYSESTNSYRLIVNSKTL